MVGLGTIGSCGVSVRILTSICPSLMLTNIFHQTWPDGTRSSMRTSRFGIYDFPGSIRFGFSSICSVGLFLLLMCRTTWFTCHNFLTTRIGNLLGEMNARRANVASNTSIMMAFTVGCIWRYARSLLILSFAIQSVDDWSKYPNNVWFVL